MENKKKDFYAYVDTLHTKNEEIHKDIQAKEKIRQIKQNDIEQMKETMKQNEIAIMHLNTVNKNKELTYLNFQREVNIQKTKLQNLQTLLQEIPLNIDKEEKQYLSFKKETQDKINDLLNNFEPFANLNTIEETKKEVKNLQNARNELNELIQEKYKQINNLNDIYDQVESEYQELLQLEKSQKKKMKNVGNALQFAENISKEIKNQRKTSEYDLLLKKKLEDIYNDSYM